jgi:hypothetical protein
MTEPRAAKLITEIESTRAQLAATKPRSMRHDELKRQLDKLMLKQLRRENREDKRRAA